MPEESAVMSVEGGTTASTGSASRRSLEASLQNPTLQAPSLQDSASRPTAQPPQQTPAGARPSPVRHGALRPVKFNEDRAMLRVTCRGNKITFWIDDIVSSARGMAMKMGRYKSDVYTASAAHGPCGPFTLFVSKEFATILMVDAEIDLMNKEEEEATFTLEELDAEGYTVAAKEGYLQRRAEREAERARGDKPKVRLFVDLPDLYGMMADDEYEDRVKDLQTMLGESIARICDDDVRMGFFTAESQETDVRLLSFGVVANFRETTSLEDAGAYEWHGIKYLDDGISKDAVKVRIPRKEIEAMGLAPCCFRAKDTCAKAKEDGTGVCLARTEFYDRRRGRTKRTREDVSDERAAKATRKAEEGEVRAIKSAGRVTGTCRKWLQGCCQRVVTRDSVRRGHCRRAHGSDIPAIDTERASERDAEEVKASIAIVCMSVPGGPCYDSTYLCPFGTDACPYSHELLAPVITGPPAPGGEQA